MRISQLVCYSIWPHAVLRGSCLTAALCVPESKALQPPTVFFPLRVIASPETQLNLDLSHSDILCLFFIFLPECSTSLFFSTPWPFVSITLLLVGCERSCAAERETPGLSSLGNPGESGLEKGADCLSDSFGGNPKTRLLPTLSANKCTHIEGCTRNQTPMLNPHTAPQHSPTQRYNTYIGFASPR